MKRFLALYLGAMLGLFVLGWTATAVLSAEINDLNQVDANNTGRFPENMAPSAVNDGARALEGIIARFYGDIGGRVVTGGSATAYTYAATQTIGAYYDGLILTFDAHTTNTGSATLAVDGLSGITLKKYNDVNLAAGDIEAGGKYMVVYDGTNFQVLSAIGNAPLTNVSEDTSPTLGGNLDGGGFALTLLQSAAVTTITEGGTRVGLVGRQTIWIPAGAMVATSTSGAVSSKVETTANRPDLNVLDFDKDQDEHAQFSVAFPKSWDRSTLNFQGYWTESSGSATTGIALGLQCVAVGNDDTIDVAYGTPIVVTDDATGTAEDLMVTAESSALTVAGTPAIDDLTFCRAFRDVSDANDDYAGDMRLLGIKLFYSTQTGNDS